jgi:hypothetical protein
MPVQYPFKNTKNLSNMALRKDQIVCAAAIILVLVAIPMPLYKAHYKIGDQTYTSDDANTNLNTHNETEGSVFLQTAQTYDFSIDYNAENATIRLSFDPGVLGQNDLDLVIYDSNGNVIGESKNPAGTDETIEISYPSQGTYRAEVGAYFCEGSCEYTLSTDLKYMEGYVPGAQGSNPSAIVALINSIQSHPLYVVFFCLPLAMFVAWAASGNYIRSAIGFASSSFLVWGAYNFAVGPALGQAAGSDYDVWAEMLPGGWMIAGAAGLLILAWMLMDKSGLSSRDIKANLKKETKLWRSIQTGANLPQREIGNDADLRPSRYAAASASLWWAILPIAVSSAICYEFSLVASVLSACSAAFAAAAIMFIMSGSASKVPFFFVCGSLALQIGSLLASLGYWTNFICTLSVFLLALSIYFISISSPNRLKGAPEKPASI